MVLAPSTESFAPKDAAPMDVLRTGVSALGLYDPDRSNNAHDANDSKATRLTSQIAMIVAAYDRIRKGKNVVQPDPSLSHAANFLLLLSGERPSAAASARSTGTFCPHSV